MHYNWIENFSAGWLIMVAELFASFLWGEDGYFAADARTHGLGKTCFGDFIFTAWVECTSLDDRFPQGVSGEQNTNAEGLPFVTL